MPVVCAIDAVRRVIAVCCINEDVSRNDQAGLPRLRWHAVIVDLEARSREGSGCST